MEQDLTLAVRSKGAEEAAEKIRHVKDNLSDTANKTSDLSDKLQKAGLAIGAIGVGLTAYSKSASNSYVDYVKQTNSLARLTGEAVDQTSKLQYVFQRSGVDAGESAQIIGRLSQQIQKHNENAGEAAQKQAEFANKIEGARIKIKELEEDTRKNGDASGKNKNQIDQLNLSIQEWTKEMQSAVDPLAKLGVETKNADGSARSFSEILFAIADKFKEMKSGPEETALAMELFGKKGKDMLPILNQGSEGIQAMMKKAEELGIVLSQDNVDAVAKYTAAQKTLKDAQNAFTLEVGAKALPMYQKLADAQVWVTQKMREMPEGVQQAISSVVAFGGPVATAAGAAVGFGADVAAIPWGGIAKNIGGTATKVKDMAVKFKDGIFWVAQHTAALVKNGATALATGAKWLAMNAWALIVRGSLMAWTAAQWLLNAAMTANPIGLIILAIVALVAALVLAWQHSETFRNIVTGVFTAVWNAIKWLWDWISQNWPLLLAILTGPIGIAVYMIITHWNTIKNAFLAAWQFIQSVWSGVAGWFGGVWNGIVAVFAGVGGWFASVFRSAWNAITGLFGGLAGFFRGVWNSIVSIFSSVGTSVGNAISGAVKGAINGILNGASGIINGFIDAINGAINIINKVPGVNIGKIGRLNVPRLAEGGIVKATPGGVLAQIAEGGKDEAVIPLDRLERMLEGSGGNRTTTINVYPQTADAVRQVFRELDNDTILTSRGLTPVRGANG
jgi:hypothetical protein